MDGALTCASIIDVSQSGMSQLVGLLAVIALALEGGQVVAPSASADSSRIAALNHAVAAAESALKAGDAAAAERQYGEALVQGSTILDALAHADRREADARALRQEVAATVVRASFNLGVLLVQSGQLPAGNRAPRGRRDASTRFSAPAVSARRRLFQCRPVQSCARAAAAGAREAPDDPEIRRMLALAAFNTDSYAEAAALLESDRDRLTQPAFQYAYGVALVRSDRAEEAGRIFGDLLASHGDWGK